MENRQPEMCVTTSPISDERLVKAQSEFSVENTEAITFRLDLEGLSVNAHFLIITVTQNPFYRWQNCGIGLKARVKLMPDTEAINIHFSAVSSTDYCSFANSHLAALKTGISKCHAQFLSCGQTSKQDWILKLEHMKGYTNRYFLGAIST